MKRCKKCRVLKVLDDFYRNPGARDGRRPECKAGTNAVRLQRYRLNRDQGIARVRAWQRAHPERVRARRENNRDRTNAKPREIHLRNKFGLTPAQYDDILEAQGGVCALCDAPPTQGISLHVDHDHRTGEIRGVLCVRCNNALGVFREHPDLLRRAARYVTADAKASVATAQLGTARPRAGARVAGRRGVP